MKKLQMTQPKSITFGEGCELYLTNCKQRNLREGTLRHYRQSYLQFYKFFNEDMPLEDFTQSLYNDYLLHLRETLHNVVSINSYLHDLITTLRFLMQEDYLKLYQVPHLHEDTEFRVYYSENGEATYLFDAADLLRNLRIEMPEDEAEKVLARLKESGYLD